MTQTFTCPNCGAPLDYQGSDPIIRCPYCSSSVIVPENLRAKPQFSSQPHDFTLSGSGDLGKMIYQARRIKEVKDLAQAGETDKALALYREITGADEFSARRAVGSLATGQPIVFEGSPSVTTASVSSTLQAAQAGRSASRGVGCVFFLFVLIPLIVGASFLLTSSNIFSVLKAAGINVDAPNISLPVPGAGFASQELSFGGEGSGPGLFEDVRAIAVQPSGALIYAANYDDGKIQAFDAQGAFVTQWVIPKKDGSKPYFDDLAVGRDGTIYAPVYGMLKRFDENGQPLSDIVLKNDYIDNLDIAADGTLIVIANGEDILWLSPQGEILQRVDAAISTISEDSELDAKVAVDGQGKVYVLGSFNNAVFVYDSTGKYLNRFGSDGDEAGQFRAPLAIEVDGKGRVLVSDIKGIQVFSNDGRYLDVIKLSASVAFGLALDDKGALYIATSARTVEKYSIKE